MAFRENGIILLNCPKCKNEYNLNELSLEAKRKRKRNIYCNICGKRVGILN